MAMIHVEVENDEGKFEKLEVSGLGQTHPDAYFGQIFSWETLTKRYFISYIAGLFCAYFHPVSYLINNKDSSFAVNTYYLSP